MHLFVSGTKITCCVCGTNQKVEYFNTPKIYDEITSLTGKKLHWEGKCESCKEDLIVIDIFLRAASKNLLYHYKHYKDFLPSYCTPFCNYKSYPPHSGLKVIWKRIEKKFSDIEDELHYEDLSDEEKTYRFSLAKMDIAAIQLEILRQKNIPLVQFDEPRQQIAFLSSYYSNNVWFPECYWNLSNEKKEIQGITHCNFCLGKEVLISTPLMQKLSHEKSYKIKNENKKKIQCPECKNFSYYDFREDLLINLNQFRYLYHFINDISISHDSPPEFMGSLIIPKNFSGD